MLDVGCGQGRDALPLARMGHDVVGVDLSPKGIADLAAAAAAEGLAVTGHVADITAFVPEGHFDALLFDRTLHMLDAADRHAVLARLIGHLRPGGVLLLADETSNMAGFRAVLDASGLGWDILTDRGGIPLRAAGLKAQSNSGSPVEDRHRDHRVGEPPVGAFASRAGTATGRQRSRRRRAAASSQRERHHRPADQTARRPCSRDARCRAGARNRIVLARIVATPAVLAR